MINNRGRIKILTDLQFTGNLTTDIKVAENIINNTISVHEENVADMERLIDYYYNKTDIMNKSKTMQEQINNKIAIGYPSIASTTKNSYTLSNAPKFVSRSLYTQDMVKYLNDSLDDDNYHNKTMQMALNASMTGLGYKYIRPATPQELASGIYFATIGDISPLNTYCVYSNDINKDKVCAIQFFTRAKYNESGVVIGDVTVYSLWSKFHFYEFEYDVLQYKLKGEPYALMYKMIPIVENIRTQR